MQWFLALLARFVLLYFWIKTPLVDHAFHPGWILPLLGIIFLPVTMLAYILVFIPGSGIVGWGWLWIILAFLFDVGAHSTPARRVMRQRTQKV